MAATGTPTPNIGLRIPIGTDPASVDDINYNSNLLDTKLGAVGNDSVQDQIDTLNGKMLPEEIPTSGNVTLNKGVLNSNVLGNKTLSLMNFQMTVTQLTISDSESLAQLSTTRIRPVRSTYLCVYNDVTGRPINGAMYINTSGTMTYYGEAIVDKRIVIIGTYTAQG